LASTLSLPLLCEAQLRYGPGTHKSKLILLTPCDLPALVEQARASLEAQLAQQAPEDRTALTELAWIYVCLGGNADALRIAKAATESMPIEKDAIAGVQFLTGLAQIDAHTSRPEEAVKILRPLLTVPAGEYVSVARLKIDPVWDPIRNNPEFQKLLSDPEPETVYK